jgi:hypothetical protein
MLSVWKTIICRRYPKTQYLPLYTFCMTLHKTSIQTRVLNIYCFIDVTLDLLARRQNEDLYYRTAILKVSIDNERGPNTKACRMHKTWTTHAAHQSRDFGILNIIFHTTLLPPKIQNSIHGSIITLTGDSRGTREYASRLGSFL